MFFIRMILAVALCAAPAFADLSYKTETKVTGGAMAAAMRMAQKMSKTARSAMEGATYIKGNRMADVSGDTMTIMDLDAETVTMVNHAKREYSVATFAQYQQYMAQMASRMQGKKNDVNVRYSVKINDGNKQQTVGGFPARLTVMSLSVDASDQKGNAGSMDMVNDVWLTSEVAGAEEMRAFGEKLAAKLGQGLGSRMGAMTAMLQQQGGGSALKEFQENAAKLEGVPVLTVVRMGPAGSSARMMAQAGKMPEEQPEGKDDSKPSVGGMLRGMGGLGGFGRGRQNQDAPPSQGAGGGDMLMEMAMRSYDFSIAAVSDSQVTVPAGYKQVESDIQKGLR
jgi:hypothetical protein